jgi:SMI1 / KNR4 family (SUKH-1)
MSVYRQYKHLALYRGDDPRITDAELERVEGLLGLSLPATFRDFLLHTSGAELEYVFDIPVEGRTESAMFSSVFSGRADAELADTFLYEIVFAREHEQVPAEVLPFARCAGDSILYLDLTPEGGGRIATILGSRPAWTGRPRDASFAVVADSFGEFFSSLRLDLDDIADHLRTVVHEDHLAATIEQLDIGIPSWRESRPELREAAERAQHRCSTAESL